MPEGLRRTLEFDRLYEAFGGRLVHWQDYIDDFGVHHLYLMLFPDCLLMDHFILQSTRVGN